MDYRTWEGLRQATSGYPRHSWPQRAQIMGDVMTNPTQAGQYQGYRVMGNVDPAPRPGYQGWRYADGQGPLDQLTQQARNNVRPARWANQFGGQQGGLRPSMNELIGEARALGGNPADVAARSAPKARIPLERVQQMTGQGGLRAAPQAAKQLGRMARFGRGLGAAAVIGEGINAGIDLGAYLMNDNKNVNDSMLINAGQWLGDKAFRIFNPDAAKRMDTMREEQSLASRMDETAALAREEAKAAQAVGQPNTETVSYAPDGSLRVAAGGNVGDPGVLQYYEPTTAKFTNDGKTGKVDFGQGANYATFDTSTPEGKAAAARIQQSIADGIPEYRQGRKYVNDQGANMGFKNDMEARMYAAQGGGANYAADPQATLAARLESYRQASDNINQTRAIQRGLDPRLAGLLDKADGRTLRAASAALKQQGADALPFEQQMALAQAKGTKGKAPEVKDAYDTNLNWAKGYLPDGLAQQFAMQAAASGYVFRNQAEMAAAAQEWYQRQQLLGGTAAPTDNLFQYRMTKADNPGWFRSLWANPSVSYASPGGLDVTVPATEEQALRAQKSLRSVMGQ